MTHSFVSVVIPVYNDGDRLQKTLSALENQTYPDSQYETIVIDNGSTDNTATIINEFSVRSSEITAIQSPYAARNRGIQMANGDIIALLDATCVPISSWIESAINCMEENNADLIAGDIQFELGEDPSPAELYDSIAHVQVERNVRERGVATTGNLIVRKDLFDEDHLGKFPVVRSSADVEWTGNATEAGYTLGYCPDAISTYPPKDFPGLMRKAYRVGKGKPKAWARNGSHPLLAAASGVRSLPSKVFQTITATNDDGHTNKNNQQSMPKIVFAVGILAFGVQLCGSTKAIIEYLVN
ncbi:MULTISPECIES: glycosyltransferase [Natrialbaceae]|uniref:glycosyltransferase n=1 Tax=Natrialbaceae TaxID=1644061 RepID=UPI00207D67FB|nr:glycosyltransferase [Natronococcus sp. CG52]